MDIDNSQNLDSENYQTFIKEIIERGLGIYGKDKMAEICYNSKIGLLDDYTIDWLSDDNSEALNNLIVNYAEINLPAKMTIMVLAKKHGIPLPSSFTTKKSRFFRLLGK